MKLITQSLLAALSVLLLCSTTVNAAVYKYKDAAGGMVFTDYELMPQEMQTRGLVLYDSERSAPKTAPVSGLPQNDSSAEQENAAARKRELLKQLQWEKDRRSEEKADRQRQTYLQQIKDVQAHELRMLQEYTKIQENSEKERREAEYKDALRRKNNGIDVPNGQIQPVVVVVPTEIIWSVGHAEGKSKWWVEATNPFSQAVTLTFSCRGTTMKGNSHSGTGSLSVGPRSTSRSVDLPGLPHLYWSTADCNRIR